MVRHIEIYSRLNALDNDFTIMLKHPDALRARNIVESITALVEYVDHVYTAMWRPQVLDTLSGLDARFILPVVSEIWLQENKS